MPVPPKLPPLVRAAQGCQIDHPRLRQRDTHARPCGWSRQRLRQLQHQQQQLLPVPGRVRMCLMMPQCEMIAEAGLVLRVLRGPQQAELGADEQAALLVDGAVVERESNWKQRQLRR